MDKLEEIKKFCLNNYNVGLNDDNQLIMPSGKLSHIILKLKKNRIQLCDKERKRVVFSCGLVNQLHEFFKKYYYMKPNSEVIS